MQAEAPDLKAAHAVSPPPVPRFLEDHELHARLWREGAQHWGAARYWHAHESWETVWRNADPTHAPSLRACIQLAAALHKPFQAEQLRLRGKPECAGLVHGMRRLLDRAHDSFDARLDAGWSAWFGLEWTRAESVWRTWSDKTPCAMDGGD